MVGVSVRQLLGRRWVILVGLVGLLPALTMFVQSRMGSSARLVGRFFEGPLMTLFILVLPLTSILLASLALGEERRDGTLSFLALRPIPREVITAAKLTAAWLGAWAISGVSGVLAAVVLGAASGEWGMVAPVILATGVATLAYSGVFLLVGYLTRWAVLIGAGFLFFWESGISNAADSLANISLFRIGLTAFVDHAPGSAADLDFVMAALRPGAGGAIAKAVVIGMLGVITTGLLMRRRDIA
jgi:ABC-2 type transport system permease protein